MKNNSCIIYVTHFLDGLDDWTTDLIYINKLGKIKEVSNSEIRNSGSIYKYLLYEFKNENTENDMEQKSNKIVIGNAGGYCDGVLINYKTE